MNAKVDDERWLLLGPQSAKLPEHLLLEHSKGHVLFITGAGTSLASGLPSFRQLVIDAYETIDAVTHSVIAALPDDGSIPPMPVASLDADQCAEVRRFCRGEYDVVLGMLERRIDGEGAEKSKVRGQIEQLIRHGRSSTGSVPKPVKASGLHRALMRLADRGGVQTIATTNFDLLLEQVAARNVPGRFTQALGAIPRPGRRKDFAGVLHLHGALSSNPTVSSNLVVSDQDFGEYYLRRRVIPDFIYDAARLFSIVLVGYSVSDAPMRYLLNAVAADGSRFRDLKDRYAFVATDDPADPIEMRDWRKRGIIPIPYARADAHSQLTKTLEAWAKLSAINGRDEEVIRAIKRLVKRKRATSPQESRDLFDHLFRRANAATHARYLGALPKFSATEDWLTAANDVLRERLSKPS